MTGGSHPAPLTALGQGLAEEIGRSGQVAGVGIDAVDIGRFARVLARRTHLADRLFTVGELAYARAAADPVPRLSTRFAAKEATMKAFGVGLGSFPFHDVEVVREGLEAPRLVLHGDALALARRDGRDPVAPLAHPHRADGPGPGGAEAPRPTGHRRCRPTLARP